jgi:hypothetical protein
LLSVLRQRLPELKSAVATRIYAISDPRDVADPGYLHGLGEAVAAAIEYRLGVDRRTVRNRLGGIEELLGRPLTGSLADLEIALRARRLVPCFSVLRRLR